MGVHAFACRRAIGRHVSVQESVQGEGGMLVLEHGFNVAHSCVKARGGQVCKCVLGLVCTCVCVCVVV